MPAFKGESTKTHRSPRQRALDIGTKSAGFDEAKIGGHPGVPLQDYDATYGHPVTAEMPRQANKSNVVEYRIKSNSTATPSIPSPFKVG